MTWRSFYTEYIRRALHEKSKRRGLLLRTAPWLTDDLKSLTRVALEAHCKSRDRVKDDKERLIVIMFALICLADAASQKPVSLDIETDGSRKPLSGYSTGQLVKAEENAASALRKTGPSAYADDWGVFKDWLLKDEEKKGMTTKGKMKRALHLSWLG